VAEVAGRWYGGDVVAIDEAGPENERKGSKKNGLKGMIVARFELATFAASVVIVSHLAMGGNDNGL
jgi:hypothetical protein